MNLDRVPVLLHQLCTIVGDHEFASGAALICTISPSMSTGTRTQSASGDDVEALQKPKVAVAQGAWSARRNVPCKRRPTAISGNPSPDDVRFSIPKQTSAVLFSLPRSGRSDSQPGTGRKPQRNVRSEGSGARLRPNRASHCERNVRITDLRKFNYRLRQMRTFDDSALGGR
jgi:hypothetical protein